MKKITTMPNITYEYELGSSEIKKETIKGNIPIGPKEYDKLKFIKISSTSNVAVGEVFDYIFIIINGYNTTVENINISEKIDENLKFIDNSIKIDNKIYKDESINNGIKISRLDPNEMKQISFKVKLINNPDFGKIVSQGNCIYSFSNQDITARESIDSNLVTINTSNSNIGISLISSSITISKNKKVKFNTTITNTGKLILKELNIFLDLPIQAKLDMNKIKVNKKNVYKVDLRKGLRLEDLKPGDTHYIEYEIKLINDEISKLTSSIYATYNLETQYDKIISDRYSIDLKVEKLIILKPYFNDDIILCDFENYYNIEKIKSNILVKDYKLLHGIKYNEVVLDGFIIYKIIYYDISINKLSCVSIKQNFNKKVKLPNDYKYDDTKIIKIDTYDLCYKFINNTNIKVYGNLAIELLII
ncbi:hypothetical protein CHL78_001285 [Romboutsia weinsteinii]|uniref:DUF11 domain-containing protein n=1 Tax=Romboutsia weinsteinii TaxID=2020949 RepID=A0A371J9B9_9FIRM|nr:hypothetical protein [Romboutsia weinsteinii]RDY29360.1 hypothetical protein CHL78_001285 [Romboutsia weinsteinii]